MKGLSEIMSIIEKTVLNEVQLEELKKPSNVKGQDDDNNFEKAIIISQPADRSEPFLAFLFLGVSFFKKRSNVFLNSVILLRSRNPNSKINRHLTFIFHFFSQVESPIWLKLLRERLAQPFSP